MRRLDEPLDLAPFTRTPLALYRIVRSKYADLSGIGAARSPGRWNRLGEEMIYTSLNSSTAQLEVLGHAKKHFIPTNLVRMKIQISGEWEGFNSDGDTVHWYRERNTKALIAAFLTVSAAEAALVSTIAAHIHERALLAVAVPSVHDDQWNVLLRPGSLHFGALASLVEVKPFAFDPRLFPEEALEEQG